jgi:hypothetical protein
MAYLSKFSKQKQLAPTLILISVILLATWMGDANGGYSVGRWALVAILLAILALIVSIRGALRGTESRWSTAALGLFAAFTLWTFASILWSPNRGDAWLGAGQTLLYLLAFWLAVGLVSLGASRRWVLAASAIGPALIAALTLPVFASHIQNFFYSQRLFGTVGYYNGEAAFLLVPFWVAIYLGGSRRINPVLRGLILAGAVLSVDTAILTQSRGAMVAMAISLPVFFLISGQRLRGLFALAPLALALLVTFPDLNEVYLALPDQESAAAAFERALPAVWLAAVGVGLYGLLWGLLDRRWEPTSNLTRVVGGTALLASVAVVIFGIASIGPLVGNPVSWGEQKWEAFKNNGTGGQEQSRYLPEPGFGKAYALAGGLGGFHLTPALGHRHPKLRGNLLSAA